MTKRELSALGAVLAACTGAAADHETLGDRAYVDHSYGDALVEFQLALRQDGADPVLMHKAAMAALNSRDLGEAVVQFRALAEEDVDQSMLAADGLDRVARAASSAGNRAVLHAAIQGLREVAPNRALRSFAKDLAIEYEDSAASNEALSIILFAAGAAPDARLQDSLMYGYGVMLVRLGRCDAAVAVFESVLLRQREMSVQSGARLRAAACAFESGRRRLNRGEPGEAATWFERAIAVGDNNYPARRAYLGLGDVRFAQGDYEGTADAFRNAMIGGSATDSISRAAQRGLDRVTGFVSVDTTGTVIR
ncbi:MAG: tetratricopeptide repeat protein [Gemmatimonadetes bacterium]|nr:tetratricopeptide repeat protein [Gemmatimonadota bacterium]